MFLAYVQPIRTFFERWINDNPTKAKACAGLLIYIYAQIMLGLVLYDFQHRGFSSPTNIFSAIIHWRTLNFFPYCINIFHNPKKRTTVAKIITTIVLFSLQLSIIYLIFMPRHNIDIHLFVTNIYLFTSVGTHIWIICATALTIIAAILIFVIWAIIP